MHPPCTPKPSKNQSCWSKNAFFDGFGVLGWCKSILNVTCLHKSYIAELFGPRVFWFSEGQKKVFSVHFSHFCSDLKKNFNTSITSLIHPPPPSPWFSFIFSFFLTSLKKRKPSVQKVLLCTIYRDILQLKLICTH